MMHLSKLHCLQSCDWVKKSMASETKYLTECRKGLVLSR